MVPSQLVDARNWADLKDTLIKEIASSGLIGFDIETEDSRRHDGLNRFMKVNDEGHKSKGKKLVFDTRRTTITGFSWYCDESDRAYYLNLNHADVENRVSWDEARQLIDAKSEDAHWICHNAPFEICMMQSTYGVRLPDVLCTLQLAVSAFNADQYPKEKMFGVGFGGIQNLLAPIAKEFAVMSPDGELTEKQADLLGKVIGKTSQSDHSYNGLVASIAYGYGLKKLVKNLFNYEMDTFLETLGENAHMGQLTGEQVVSYGADDAYWAVRLFHRLLPMLPYQNDQLLDTYFEQENPMIYVYADTWREGMRLNLANVEKQRERERRLYAEKIRELQGLVREQLPFPDAPNEGLMKEGWYAKSEGKTYRRRIEAWADLDLENVDDFTAATSTGGSVSKPWAVEQGFKESSIKGPNFTHYMMMRTLLYDLPGIKPIMQKGKVGSDADARSRLRKKINDTRLVDLIDEIAGIEQRMKLYLNPYLMLCDPETRKVHPVLSSELNSRRMAMAFPNAMQLAKQGESTYIRGFYEADQDDHVLVAIDWSQIELVLIGDFSDDEGFREAFGQLPYNDLHKKAVSNLMDIAIEDVTKDLRKKIGKGANFNYWYSGALSTVGDVLGWSSDKMWEMTERYRETFPDAEEWRQDQIATARDRGYVTLPDGHRRTKFEATYEWQGLWRQRFNNTGSLGLQNFGDLFVRRLTSRAGNQIVNSMIQGSCATLAKRSILRIIKKIDEIGFRARFALPVHDELVFSVHKDDVVAFIRMAKEVMCDHPDIIQHLYMDATASIGRTFEPYHPERAPKGQIELDEAPALPGWLPPETEDEKLDEEQIQSVINYLFTEDTNALRAA